mmetsp:Transcript_15218/g.42607  ORF Transcript_15218/g.42607 Transcript_15218/m.42607 type:complete len:361 (+) Transcript_15218:205-1287(+)
MPGKGLPLHGCVALLVAFSLTGGGACDGAVGLNRWNGMGPQRRQWASRRQEAPTGQERGPAGPRTGIMIWAAGRSGTTAFWQTTKDWTERGGMSLGLICNKKEPFHETMQQLTEENWSRCLGQGRGPYMLHVKPMHLRKAEKQCQTPEGMFRTAKKMGVKVVVMVDRRNWLARKISAGERYTMDVLKIPKHAWRWKNNQEKWERRLKFFSKFFSYANETETKAQWLDRQRHFEMDDPEELRRGAEFASQLGMLVLNFTFNKQNWPCKEVTATVKAAVEERVLPGMPPGGCAQRHGRSDFSSFRFLPLDRRIGPEASALILDALKGTDDEWMLDLSRESPPSTLNTGQAPSATGNEPQGDL